MLDNLQQNPLPNSYMVYVNDKASADRVSKEAPEIAGVSDIKYYQDTVEKLSKITRAVEVGSVVMMAFLIVVSVILVANTIKLTVFNRAKEIKIMKYLGDGLVCSGAVCAGRNHPGYRLWQWRPEFWASSIFVL